MFDLLNASDSTAAGPFTYGSAVSRVNDERLKKALDVLSGLRKGKGVRRPDLKKFLGSDLATLWGIGAADTADQVRAKVVLQLERGFARLDDPKLARIGRVYFNTADEAADSGLTLGGRKDALCRELGDSPRTLDRLAEQVFECLEACLRGGVPALHPAEVEAYLRRAPAPAGCEAFIHEARRTPTERFAPGFLASRVHGLHGDGGRLRVVGDTAIGDWVVVFTTSARLAAYQLAKPQFSGFTFAITGVELLRRYAEQGLRAGLVVNPDCHRDSGALDAFSLTSAQVIEIIDSTPFSIGSSSPE